VLHLAAATFEAAVEMALTLLLAPLLPASRSLAAEGHASLPCGEDMLGLGKIIRHEIWLLHDIVQATTDKSCCEWPTGP